MDHIKTDDIDPKNRALLVIKHLLRRGHISQGTATVEYGADLCRLSDAIHRLRNEDADLVPPGQEIVTVHKLDTNGRRYGEYVLVQRAPLRKAA